MLAMLWLHSLHQAKVFASLNKANILVDTTINIKESATSFFFIINAEVALESCKGASSWLRKGQELSVVLRAMLNSKSPVTATAEHTTR